MKHQVKAVLTLAMAAVLTLSLASCGLLGDNMVKDSQTYVQGRLDCLYLGKYNQDYMDLIDLTEDEARAKYEDWLSQEVDIFCDYMGVEYPTDEYKTQVAELYKEIYTHAKYTVNPSTKLDSGAYAVEVDVEPIELLTLVTDDDTVALWDELTSDEALAEYDFDAMSEDEYNALYEQIDQKYAQGVLELVRAQLPNLSYGDPQSIVFQLKEDEDGLYTEVESDIQQFDQYIILY